MNETTAFSGMTYSLRPSIRRTVNTFALTPRGLTLSSSTRRTRIIDYRDVVEVNLAHFGNTGARCVVRPRKGRAIAIPSREFRGLGKFADRSETFERFVVALHERLEPHRDHIAFTRGHAFLHRFMLGCIALFALAFAVGLIAVLLGKTPEWRGVRVFIAGPVLAVAAWVLAKRCKPGAYDPRSALPYGIGATDEPRRAAAS